MGRINGAWPASMGRGCGGRHGPFSFLGWDQEDSGLVLWWPWLGLTWTQLLVSQRVTRLFVVVGIASCCMVAGCSPTTGWQWVPTHTHVHVPPSLSSSPLPPAPCQGMGTMLMVPLVAPCHVTSVVATFPCITHCGHADATKHPPQTQLEREDLRPKTSLRPHVP